jgi:hypothetical protein
MLSPRHHHQRRQQGAEGAAGVSAHLEDGLRQPAPTASRHEGDAGGLGMENGGPSPHEHGRGQNVGKITGVGYRDQSGQREPHADRQ